MANTSATRYGYVCKKKENLSVLTEVLSKKWRCQRGGALVATTEALASQRSAQRAYHEVTEEFTKNSTGRKRLRPPGTSSLQRGGPFYSSN